MNELFIENNTFNKKYYIKLYNFLFKHFKPIFLAAKIIIVIATEVINPSIKDII